MNKEILTFSNIEIYELKFPYRKKLIFLENVDIDNKLMSRMGFFGEKL